MKRVWKTIWCAVVVVLAFCSQAGYSQQPQGAASQAGAVKTKSEEVLLDVVVRDKKGRPVNDLQAQNFQVFDNGQPKKIDSFRLIAGNQAVSAGGTRQQLDPLRQVRLVTMVFHCYSNTARDLARTAAVDLLKAQLPQNVYMSVMAIDHTLEVLQPFTNDLGLLKRAVDRATVSQVTDYSKDTATVQKNLEDMLGPATNGELTPEQQIADANATLAAQGRNAPGSSLANVAMAQMVLDMIRTEQSSAMMESGRTEIWSLLDAIKEQYRLPGRKTLLYFTEGGFQVPEGMKTPFKDIISIANRSNVSIYAVDARGLDTMRENQGVSSALNQAAQASRNQQTSNGNAPVTPDEAALFDTAIESTRANTEATLANLADSTGGVLIANTNDLRGPIDRVAEDVETYYEITYAPDIEHYDGSFHKIALKVEPRGLRVQSRAGYFAFPPELANSGAVVQPYEVPLFDALNSAQPPKSFEFHAQGFHYRGRHDVPTCDLVVDVPLANLTFQKNNQDQYSGRLAYVALVKNAQGDVVEKFGNDIPINVPGAKLDALKVSHFTYTEHFNLPPGYYTLDAAVLDGAGNRISTRKSSLIMPAATAGLGISSVAVIRGTRDSGASPDPSDPFLVGAKVIEPTLSPVISKANSKSVSFYVVIYPDHSDAIPPRLAMEFSLNGQLLGGGSPQLGTPGADGSIRYVATAPLAPFNAGEIGVQFIVTQGTERAEEDVSFTLQ